MMKKVLFVAMATLCACVVHAQMRLGIPFTNGAVLQRDCAVPVWGTASAGEKVTVEFAGQSVSTTADKDGKWCAKLAPMAASCESRELVVKGAQETKKISDVLVGEVWFCSGQSNADVSLCGGNVNYRDAKGTMRARMTNKPLIRFIRPNRNNSRWYTFTPQNLLSPSFSAMGFYFALELYNALNIPVGILGAYVGGTSIESWTPNAGGNWQYFVSACTPYAMRGFIWYQGCANVITQDSCDTYVGRMRLLYDGWSKAFQNPNLKLYFVQLAPFEPWWRDKYRAVNGNASVQEAQAKFAASEKNAGMIVINDYGDLKDVHPKNKEIVGQRLAAMALSRDYGFTEIQAESPTLKSWKIEGDQFILTFNDANNWYFVGPPVGFEIAGTNGVFEAAKIVSPINGQKIKGNTLIIKSDKVKEPAKLRYLYTSPWKSFLYNDADLPLGVFHIGD